MRPLPPRLSPGVRRVLVAGSTGAGKSTMARALALCLELPYTNLDDLWNGSGWVKPKFADDVAALLATDRWITEYQYDMVKEDLLTASQAVVWLDHPRSLVATRLLRRSLVSAVRGSRVSGGAVQLLRHWACAFHPLRVVLSRRFAARRGRTAEELGDAQRRGVVVVRLRGARQAKRWLAAQRRELTCGGAVPPTHGEPR